MSITVRETLTAALDSGDIELDLGAGTQAGDVLDLTVSTDFYTLGDISQPTGKWNLIHSIDNGDGSGAYLKRWWLVVTSGGAQTITVPRNTDAFHHCRLRVLAGVNTGAPVDDDAINHSGISTATSQVAPSVAPTSAGGLLACHWMSDEDSTNYTAPGGMTGDGEIDGGTFSTSFGAHEQIAAAGPTGTRTATTAAARKYVASSVVYRAAGATPPTHPYKVGDRGSAHNLTSSTSTAVDLPSAGSIAVGSVLIARLSMDNSGLNGIATTVAITDPRSNVWVVGAAANQDPGAAAAGISCRVAYCVVANAYTDGDDLTITYGNNTAADTTVVEEWANIDTDNPEAVAQTVAAGGSATPSVSRTPTAAGQLFYGALGIEGPLGDAYTQDADTTDGAWASLTSLSTASGTAASNATVRGAYKLVTGTTGQTWNPSITSRDWAAVALVFNPAPAGGTPVDGAGVAAGAAVGLGSAAKTVGVVGGTAGGVVGDATGAKSGPVRGVTPGVVVGRGVARRAAAAGSRGVGGTAGVGVGSKTGAAVGVGHSAAAGVGVGAKSAPSSGRGTGGGSGRGVGLRTATAAAVAAAAGWAAAAVAAVRRAAAAGLGGVAGRGTPTGQGPRPVAGTTGGGTAGSGLGSKTAAGRATSRGAVVGSGLAGKLTTAAARVWGAVAGRGVPGGAEASPDATPDDRVVVVAAEGRAVQVSESRTVVVSAEERVVHVDGQ
jgi:hypothetical protein